MTAMVSATLSSFTPGSSIRVGVSTRPAPSTIPDSACTHSIPWKAPRHSMEYVWPFHGMQRTHVVGEGLDQREELLLRALVAVGQRAQEVVALLEQVLHVLVPQNLVSVPQYLFSVPQYPVRQFRRCLVSVPQYPVRHHVSIPGPAQGRVTVARVTLQIEPGSTRSPLQYQHVRSGYYACA
eukprot:665019-Rhodomonas_salina.3